MREEAHHTDPGEPDRPREVLRIPAFRLFWSAVTIRAFGGSIAGVAFQLLIVTVVAATVSTAPVVPVKVTHTVRRCAMADFCA